MDLVQLPVWDEETPPNVLMVFASSSNTNLIPNQNLLLQGANGSLALAIHPATNQFGNATIFVTVSYG